MVRTVFALAAAMLLTLTGVVVGTRSTDAKLGAVAVEGHSSFVTLEIEARQPPPVAGLAVCEHRVNLPSVLNDFFDAVNGCTEKLEAVFATPSTIAAPADSPLTPTGRGRDHTDANGIVWTTTEYGFVLPDGTMGLTYVVLTAEEQVHPDNGERYNFVLAPLTPPKGADWTHLMLTSGPAP